MAKVAASVPEDERAWHQAQIEKLRAASDRAPLWREVADRIGWPTTVLPVLALAPAYQEALDLPMGGFRAEMLKIRPRGEQPAAPPSRA
jgi:hypothetical protein